MYDICAAFCLLFLAGLLLQVDTVRPASATSEPSSMFSFFSLHAKILMAHIHAWPDDGHEGQSYLIWATIRSDIIKHYSDMRTTVFLHPSHVSSINFFLREAKIICVLLSFSLFKVA
jgi:hypothetical protein